jgi:hypothetical protein
LVVECFLAEAIAWQRLKDFGSGPVGPVGEDGSVRTGRGFKEFRVVSGFEPITNTEARPVTFEKFFEKVSGSFWNSPYY